MSHVSEVSVELSEYSGKCRKANDTARGCVARSLASHWYSARLEVQWAS